MSNLNVKLEIFEGPLDLLLHLIKTLEIDIYDIPIAEITEQYMAYIKSMKVLDLEVAGDYIVMAATLMSIKSKMLLPKVEVVFDDELEYDEDDPREQLVAQLLEYRKYKYGAQVLKEKESERGLYYTRESATLDDYREAPIELVPNEITTIDLFLAFHDILNRQKEQREIPATIITEEFTIEGRVELIRQKLKGLKNKSFVSFDSLFERYHRMEIVTTFMAVLELMKEGEVVARQSDPTQPILLFAK